VLGRSGVEKIIQLKLKDDELAALKRSADSIRQNVEVMTKLLVTA